MARISGVKTGHDSQGRLATITIDLKKHPGAVELLKDAGLIEKSTLRQEVEANPENYSTVNEVFDRLEDNIKSWEW